MVVKELINHSQIFASNLTVIGQFLQLLLTTMLSVSLDYLKEWM